MRGLLTLARGLKDRLKKEMRAADERDPVLQEIKLQVIERRILEKYKKGEGDNDNT